MYILLFWMQHKSLPHIITSFFLVLITYNAHHQCDTSGSDTSREQNNKGLYKLHHFPAYIIS